MMRAVMWWWVALGMVLAGVASGCSDRAPEEARLLLERIDAIEAREAPNKRRAQVEKLRDLPLHVERVRKVRDLCARAHGALLEAETQQAKAEQALAALHGDEDTNGRLERPRHISARIERSNAALERARNLLPRCKSKVAALSARYAKDG